MAGNQVNALLSNETPFNDVSCKLFTIYGYQSVRDQETDIVSWRFMDLAISFGLRWISFRSRRDCNVIHRIVHARRRRIHPSKASHDSNIAGTSCVRWMLFYLCLHMVNSPYSIITDIGDFPNHIKESLIHRLWYIDWDLGTRSQS